MTDLTDDQVRALAHRYRFAKDDHERTIAQTALALLTARAEKAETECAAEFHQPTDHQARQGQSRAQAEEPQMTMITKEQASLVLKAVTRAEAAEAKLVEWQASQHYAYIGRDGKTVLARDLEARAEAAEAELATLRAAEKELSDAYLRIREKLGAWNTAHGGADRFAVTEAAVDALRKKVERLTGAATLVLSDLEMAFKPHITFVELIRRKTNIALRLRAALTEKNTP